MSGPDDTYPRAVFDAHGTYTVRTGASYCVEDSRVRELAEIGYARRDVAKAYDFLTRCLDDNDSERPGECEESLWEEEDGLDRVVDLGVLVRSERRRLAHAQSKVKGWERKAGVRGAREKDLDRGWSGVCRLTGRPARKSISGCCTRS